VACKYAEEQQKFFDHHCAPYMKGFMRAMGALKGESGGAAG
jgi:hypothetical protein